MDWQIKQCISRLREVGEGDKKIKISFPLLNDDTKQLSADSSAQVPKEAGGGGDRMDMQKGCPKGRH